MLYSQPQTDLFLLFVINDGVTDTFVNNNTIDHKTITKRTCQDFLLRQTALRKGSREGMPNAEATTAKARAVVLRTYLFQFTLLVKVVCLFRKVYIRVYVKRKKYFYYFQKLNYLFTNSQPQTPCKWKQRREKLKFQLKYVWSRKLTFLFTN